MNGDFQKEGRAQDRKNMDVLVYRRISSQCQIFPSLLFFIMLVLMPINQVAQGEACQQKALEEHSKGRGFVFQF